MAGGWCFLFFFFSPPLSRTVVGRRQAVVARRALIFFFSPSFFLFFMVAAIAAFFSFFPPSPPCFGRRCRREKDWEKKAFTVVFLLPLLTLWRVEMGYALSFLPPFRPVARTLFGLCAIIVFPKNNTPPACNWDPGASGPPFLLPSLFRI